MQEVTSQHWHGPEGYKNAGYGAWNRPNTPDDDYRQALRLIGCYGPNNHRKDKAGVPGEKDTDEGAIDVTEGGIAIPYWPEDPFLRKEYEDTLRKEGVTSKMEESLPGASESVISIQR
jgi:hypothetical protein